jgi:hypothetical protein
MSSLFHLIFEILRIGFLSLVYGFIIWLIITKVLRQKQIKRMAVFAILFVSLIIWRNTYWRNNGYGDYARVPVTSEYEIEIVDCNYLSINKNEEQLKGVYDNFKSIYIHNDSIFASDGQRYLIVDCLNGKIHRNLNKLEFNNLNGNNSYLLNLCDFHYKYWGIRLFLI